MKFTIAMKSNGLLQKLPNTKNWVVKSQFVWYMNYQTKETPFIVPVSFVTDFASIPTLFRIFFNPTRYIAYILHDFLMYEVKKGTITRKQADLILIEALHIEGASKIERILVYIGVRIGALLGIGKK